MTQKQIQIVSQKAKTNSLEHVVGAQLLFYCFNKGVWLNKSEFDTLLYICLNGYKKKDTLREIVERKIFKSEQCVRNARRKLVLLGLLIEPSKRHFEVNPEINFTNKGSILFECKILRIDES